MRAADTMRARVLWLPGEGAEGVVAPRVVGSSQRSLHLFKGRDDDPHRLAPPCSEGGDVISGFVVEPTQPQHTR
eukprot:scaffold14360_cov57-Phaeocystis_antarctica.AAC.4